MSIYNKYGAVTPEAQDKLYKVVEAAHVYFIVESNEDFRALTNEFVTFFHGRCAEDILRRGLATKRIEKLKRE